MDHWTDIAFECGNRLRRLEKINARRPQGLEGRHGNDVRDWCQLGSFTIAQKAAVSDMFEVQAAKLEVQNGKSKKIKAFAKDMVKDHSASTDKLKAASAKEGVILPTGQDPERQQKLAALKPLRGVELDAAYASTQISVRTAAVALIDAYSKDGKGGALKAFAPKLTR